MERPTAIKECPKHGMTEHVYIDNVLKIVFNQLMA